MAESKLNIVIIGKDKASGAIGKVGSSLKGLGKLAIIGTGAAVAGIGAVGVAAFKMAMDAAPVEGIGRAFEGLTTDLEGGTDAMLASLKEGSLGMVAQRDLMMSFNKAAGLVSKDFATTMPDAMQYLSKVSAATGQDLNYLLDSYVTGIGRLSPMILDNLQIQVSQAEATERAAEMFGVATKELSKEQQQMGMANVVMEKLAKNTADMPDITENMSTKLAQASARMQDMKDKIGLALIPVVMKLMDAFGTLVNKYGPIVMEFFQMQLLPFIQDKLVPGFELIFGVVQTVIDVFSGLVEGIAHLLKWGELLHPSEFIPGFFELPTAVQNIIESIQWFLADLVEGFISLADQVRNAIAPIWEWIQGAFSLQDVLIGLGALIAAIIIPLIMGLISFLAGLVLAFAPLILAIGAVIAIAMLLRKAWESNFMGIRDVVANVIAKIKEIIGTVIAWVQENWPKFRDAVLGAIQTVVAWVQENWPKIQETIIGVVQAVWDFVGPIVTEIASFIQEMFGIVVAWVKENWPLIKEAVEDTMNTVKKIVEDVLNWISEFWIEHGTQIMDFVRNLWVVIKYIIKQALNAILGVIKFILLLIAGHWDEAWQLIKDTVANVWNGLRDWITDTAGPFLARAVQNALDKLVEIVTTLGGKMFTAGREIIGKLKDGLESKLGEVKAWFEGKLNDIKNMLPFSEPKDPNSPLRGLSKAGEAFGENLLIGLRRSMPKVAAEISMGLAGVSGGGGNVYNFNLSAAYAQRERDDLAADVRMLQMLYG